MTKIKAWFDKHLKNQDAIGTFQIEFEGVREILRRTRIRGGKAVDIACGTGAYTFLLVDMGFQVTGVDFSKRCIQELQSDPLFNPKKILPLVVCDAMNLPFRGGCFKVALCIGMLEYYPWGEKQSFLSEMIRMVKKGGYVIFDIPVKGHPKTIEFTEMEKRVGNDIFPENATKVKKFLATRDCGVEKIQVHGFEQQFLVRKRK